MTISVHRWTMTAPKAPLERVAFDAVLASFSPDEAKAARVLPGSPPASRQRRVQQVGG